VIEVNLFSDQKLAEVIVAYRHLGILKELSILCMIELSKRRDEGSSFSYEDFIDEKLKGLKLNE
jgi:hypothetical protein